MTRRARPLPSTIGRGSWAFGHTTGRELYPDRMKLTGLAALLLAVSPLAVGCSSGDSCDDVESLSRQLDDTDIDDPDYNDINERLLRAQADCNAQ